MEYVLDFVRCDKGIIDRVGGKCAALGALVGMGAPVPPGFAITTEAFRALLAFDGLSGRIEAELRPLTSSGDPLLPEASQRARALINEAPIPSAVEAAIRSGFADLSRRSGVDNVAVAVRSSATVEDMPGASFAGQHDTSLGIVGADEVLRHVRLCWSSLYTARAIAYRLDNGFPHEKVFMAVGVQKMVNARAAGVAFTLNPSNGDRSKIAIDASFGLGEAVVSGEVTPDNFIVDKVILEVVTRVISSKHIEYAFDPGRGSVVQREVPPERRGEPALTQDEIVAVARMAKRAEAHFRSPQDVEWAIDADLPPGGSVVLLQSRPETVWSKKPRGQVTTESSRGMAGMVHTLIRGVRVGTIK